MLTAWFGWSVMTCVDQRESWKSDKVMGSCASRGSPGGSFPSRRYSHPSVKGTMNALCREYRSSKGLWGSYWSDLWGLYWSDLWGSYWSDSRRGKRISLLGAASTTGVCRCGTRIVTKGVSGDVMGVARRKGDGENGAWGTSQRELYTQMSGDGRSASRLVSRIEVYLETRDVWEVDIRRLASSASSTVPGWEKRCP
jgi:hypothetical protein